MERRRVYALVFCTLYLSTPSNVVVKMGFCKHFCHSRILCLPHAKDAVKWVKGRAIFGLQGSKVAGYSRVCRLQSMHVKPNEVALSCSGSPPPRPSLRYGYLKEDQFARSKLKMDTELFVRFVQFRFRNIQTFGKPS